MNMLNRFTTYTKEWKEVTTGMLPQKLHCYRNKQYRLSSKPLKKQLLVPLASITLVRCSIIFLTVQEKHTGNFNTVILMARRRGLWCLVYKGQEEKKETLADLENYTPSSHRFVDFSDESPQWLQALPFLDTWQNQPVVLLSFVALF